MQGAMQQVRLCSFIKHSVVNEIFSRFEQQHDDYSIIMAKALADRLAEVHKICYTGLYVLLSARL